MSRTRRRKSKPCVCFIIPPTLLGEVIHRATDRIEQRRAVATMNLSAQMQGMRVGMSSLPTGMGVRSPGNKYRLVYDAQGKTRLPGGMIRREGQPATRDAAVDEAFDGAGATYDFFQSVYRRASLDGRGLMLASTAHYGKGYDNAFWNGSQMIYGDGDTVLFNRFTKCVDVIAHELAHGFTQFCSNLDYDSESGALNEHLSDVFGSLVKQWLLGHKAETADWLIGNGIFAAGVNGQALRSLKAPGTAYDDRLLGKDPQVGHYKEYQAMEDDNGGVHVNSGIANRAFYTACMNVGGTAWDKVGRIWYEVAARKLWADADFQDMANLTWHTAGEVFGDGGAVQRAIFDGWSLVGLKPR